LWAGFFFLIVGITSGIASIVGLSQGMLGGIFGLIFSGAIIAFAVRGFQVRAVVNPQEIIAHNYLRVQRADVSTVVAMDVARRTIGESTGLCAQVRLTDGGKFWLDAINTAGRKSQESVELVKTLRQILNVGGEMPTPRSRRGKRRSDG
jgi:hypothetical protein